MLAQVQLTLALAAVAVPINTLFGISAALLIARNNFPGKTVLLAILDLPFSISPVVTGLMLVSTLRQISHAGTLCGCCTTTLVNIGEAVRHELVVHWCSTTSAVVGCCQQSSSPEAEVLECNRHSVVQDTAHTQC